MADKIRGLIVVDGAGGFIGGHISEELYRAEFHVRATDLPGVDLAFLEEQGIEIKPSNLLDRGSLMDVLSGAEAVVHCAAAFDLALPLKTLLRVNVGGTESLIDACLSAGVGRFIHISTGGVYGIPTCCPVYENHPIKPADLYSVSKARTEEKL